MIDRTVLIVGLTVYPIAVLTQMRLFVIVGVGLGIVYALEHVRRGTIPWGALKGGWPVYLFAVLIPVSSLWSIDPAGTRLAAVVFLASFTLFHASLVMFRREGHDWFCQVLLVVPYVWLGVVGVVLARYGSLRVTSAEMGQAVGSLSNVAPAATELMVPYLLYVVVTQPRRRLAAVAATSCALFVALASESRGALLLLGVTVGLVALLFGRTAGAKVRRTAALVVVGGGLVALLVGILGPEYVRAPIERLKSSQLLNVTTVETPTLEESDYVRTVMYLEGVNAIRAHGTTGIGYYALASYIEAIHGWRLISHNIILTAWGELGIAGLTAALLIVVIGTRRIWIARSWARRVDAQAFYFHAATLIAWVVALTHAQFRPQLTNPMFHVLVAAAFASGSGASPGSRDARHSR